MSNSDRKAVVQRITIDRPGLNANETASLDVYVTYHKGGLSLSGMNRPRGYWLHVQPVVRELTAGCEITTFRGFTGSKTFIETATRFSDGKLDELAARLKGSPDMIEIVGEVARRNALTLVDFVLPEQAATPVV